MGEVVLLNQHFETLTCWAKDGCGIQFGVPARYYEAACEQGFTFYCPRGHRLAIGEGEVERLKRQLEEKERRIEFEKNRRQSAEQQEKRARRAQKIATGKLRAQSERVKAGVCPCCNRTFQQLARHMQTKHPDWVKRNKKKGTLP